MSKQMKMNSRQYGVIGLIAPCWFLLIYLIMSNMRPEYSFMTKAISELGTLDAPNKGWWNVLGYMVPGVMIAIFSRGLFAAVCINTKNKWPMIGLAGSGLFMTLSGMFPGDMDNRQSFTMYMHMLGSFGSYIFFLIGAFTFPKQMKKSEYWRSSRYVTLVITWLTIVLGTLSYALPQTPGVGQRLVFFFYFLWIFYTAWKLYKMPSVALS